MRLCVLAVALSQSVACSGEDTDTDAHADTDRPTDTDTDAEPDTDRPVETDDTDDTDDTGATDDTDDTDLDTDVPVDTDADTDTEVPLDTDTDGGHTDDTDRDVNADTVDTGDTAIDTDTDDEVSWRDIADGSTYTGYPDSGDSNGPTDCETLYADLVASQAGLDRFEAEHAGGYGFYDPVDFVTEMAITAHLFCGSTGTKIDVLGVSADGPDSLLIDYLVIKPFVGGDVPTTTFNVIAVEDRNWTAVSASVTVVGGSGHCGSGP